MAAKKQKSFRTAALEFNLKAQGYREHLKALPLEHVIADFITENRGRYMDQGEFTEETIILIEELKIDIEELYMK